MTASPWIVEVAADRFQADVLDRSFELPVVVDFWAPWCQPCRLLGPILERLAQEHQGKFLLAKANSDELPEIAAAFQVEAIPSVFALRDGSIVDQFQGLLPEQDLRRWLEGILPRPGDLLAAEARDLEAVDPQAAEAKYREAIEQSPNAVAARVGLARIVLEHGNLEEARQILEELANSGLLDAEGERLQAEVLLRLQLQGIGTVEQLESTVAGNPDDLPLRLDLARALAAAGRYEQALQTCLEVVQRDRKTMGEPTRELMVQIFHLLGPESDLASRFRRKLALALY